MVTLDETDRRILTTLQQDCAITNQELAERVHVSAPTCLRRVRRLVEEGVIERQIAIVSPEALAAGLTAIVEVSLER
jgi:Lrp/AsnC family transcriptional regulator, leucine-responsive regulatory protein